MSGWALCFAGVQASGSVHKLCDCSISTDVQWLNVAINLICTCWCCLHGSTDEPQSLVLYLIQCCKVCVCVAVLRAALLYPRVGLTKPMYSCRSVCLFAPLLVLASFLTIFNRRLAFAAVFSMCFLIESFGSSYRPRYCGTASVCISSPPYLIFTPFSIVYLLQKMVYTVLFVLSFSFHRL